MFKKCFVNDVYLMLIACVVQVTLVSFLLNVHIEKNKWREKQHCFVQLLLHKKCQSLNLNFCFSDVMISRRYSQTSGLIIIRNW